MLKNRLIVLGVTGSIAAVKSPEIARALMNLGATVHTVLTDAATEFIGPLTFETLTGRPALGSLFGESRAGALTHVKLSREADGIVVAPATADFLARVACGRATDMLSTLMLAGSCPTVVAPAMNEVMWTDRATQDNVRSLGDRGVVICPPRQGALSDLSEGQGRMAEPRQVVEAVVRALPKVGELSGKSVLVTAGATRAYWDPVRYLSSPSSGRMGLALAEELGRRGADVTLIAANVAAVYPYGCQVDEVETFEAMESALRKRGDSADAVVMCAAVNDFSFSQRSDRKLARGTDLLTVQLEPTRDLVAEMAAEYPEKVIVGFAAETDKLEEKGLRKLREKGLRLVVANRVGKADVGFGAEETEISLVTESGISRPKRMAKAEAARLIVDELSRLLDA